VVDVEAILRDSGNIRIVQFQMRRSECSDSFSSVGAKVCEQESELGLGAQRKTEGQPTKN
jgi:hypothetical protein